MIIETDIPSGIREGDKDAFVSLYKHYYKPLCKYAYNLVRNLDTAEEMVQEVIFKLWERRETLSIPDHIKEYLFRSVFNNCINFLKKKSNEDLQLQQMSNYLLNESADFKDFMVVKELEDSITKAVEGLPEKTRIVFKMNRFENLTYAEIATKLEITVKGVEYHMSNALKQLTVELKEYLPLILLLLSINFN